MPDIPRTFGGTLLLPTIPPTTIPRVFGGTLILLLRLAPPATTQVVATGRDGTQVGIGRDGLVSGKGR